MVGVSYSVGVQKSGAYSGFLEYEEPAKFSPFKALWLALLMSLTMFSPIIIIHPRFSSLKIEDPLLIATFLCLMFQSRRPGEGLLGGWAGRPVFLPYICLLSWVFLVTVIATLASPHAERIALVLGGVVGHAKGLVLAIVILLMVRDKKTERFLGTVVLGLLLLQLMVLYLQRYELLGIHSWLTPRYRRAPGGPEEAYRFATGLRASGTFGNPNDAGLAVGLLAGLAVARAVFGRGTIRRTVCFLAGMFGVVVTVLYARSRGGLAASLVACLTSPLIVLLARGKRGTSGIWLVVFVVLFMIGSVYLGLSKEAERFAVFTGEQKIIEELSFAGRIGNWKLRLQNMGAGIILGEGEYATYGIATDNGFLTRLMRGGFLGLGLYLWLLIGIMMIFFKTLIARGVKDDNIYLMVGSLAMALGVFVGNMSNDPYNNNRLWAIFMMVVALGLCVRRRILCGDVSERDYNIP